MFHSQWSRWSGSLCGDVCVIGFQPRIGPITKETQWIRFNRILSWILDNCVVPWVMHVVFSAVDIMLSERYEDPLWWSLCYQGDSGTLGGGHYATRVIVGPLVVAIMLSG